jgi:hypothetical protein
VRSPESSLIGQQLTAVLQEDGYLAVSGFDDPSAPEGGGIACLTAFLRTVGGEAWRKDAVAHLIARLSVKERQTTNIISSAKNAGEIRSTEVGRQSRLLLVDHSAAE